MADYKGEKFEFPDEKETQAATEDDKFEVEIEDDTPPEDRGRVPAETPPADPTEDELKSYDEKVQARIKKFTRGYHDERRAKEEALRERQAAEVYAKQVIEENKRLQQQLANGSEAYIQQSKNSAELELATAKKRYREAFEEGNAEAMADAQADIANAALKIDRAQGMKPLQVREKEVQIPQSTETPRMSTRDQRWLEENTWFGPDDEMTAAALGLHKKLISQHGEEFIGSDEYYKTIDATMRRRFPENFEDSQSDEEDTPPPKKRVSEPDEEETPRRATKPATVVAPASRSTPPNRIRLKASEAAIARRLGVPLELYAKQVAQLRNGE
jgi:hypothetical protein